MPHTGIRHAFFFSLRCGLHGRQQSVPTGAVLPGDLQNARSPYEGDEPMGDGYIFVPQESYDSEGMQHYRDHGNDISFTSDDGGHNDAGNDEGHMEHLSMLQYGDVMEHPNIEEDYDASSHSGGVDPGEHVHDGDGFDGGMHDTGANEVGGNHEEL